MTSPASTSACQHKKKPFQLCLTTDVKRFSNGTFNSSIESRPTDTQRGTCRIESFQDSLIKLGIKSHMHISEIRTFSLNNDIVKLTKIMNNLVKDLKILSFKDIFQCQSFHFFSVKTICLGDQLISLKFLEDFDFQCTLFNKKLPNFCRLCS